MRNKRFLSVWIFAFLFVLFTYFVNHGHVMQEKTDTMKQYTNATPQKIFLKEYSPPHFQIPDIDLRFEIFDEYTDVRSDMRIIKKTMQDPLILDGEDLDLHAIYLNEKKLSPSSYEKHEKKLLIFDLPQDHEFSLRIETRIYPQNNRELSGLYQSGKMLCTQCESEGFRRITYFIDRPDVMSRYKTTITADRTQYPTILSNGNLLKSEPLENNKIRVKYHDPFPKPCYLFAIIAGDLQCVKDRYLTMNGRMVNLEVFVNEGEQDKIEHAMNALKNAMEWDEKTFGREYDLDDLRMVAIKDFNAGAMENKSLMTFNEECILGCRESATDDELQFIEGCVAHEYFHNWTGNRITLRDWFNLALKEGLTNFRNQEFSAEMNSAPVVRINDVRSLRLRQFAEDAGPTAHPVLPQEYVVPDDSYTSTTYDKGAEIFRMLQTLLGKQKFREGMDCYFNENDGKAVAIQNVLQAMQGVIDYDISQFANWFEQAGTPEADVKMNYNDEKHEVQLTVSQKCRPTKECQNKKPFYFPLVIGFLDQDGKDIPLKENILHISKEKEIFTFDKIQNRPVPSLLRNFSAPIKLSYPYSHEELCFLLSYDHDPFNRYEAGQRLLKEQLHSYIRSIQNGWKLAFDEKVIEAFGKILSDKSCDQAFKAEIFVLPLIGELVEELDVYDFEASHKAREAFYQTLAKRFEREFLDLEEALRPSGGPFSIDSSAMGKRKLRNICLTYLSKFEDQRHLPLIFKSFKEASNMTDSYHNLALLCHSDSLEREKALDIFYERWKDNDMVINKWFSAQVGSTRENTLADVKKLISHKAYKKDNPNKIRSVLARFASNELRFNDPSGKGFEFLADRIIDIDSFNKSMSSRLALAFKKYPKLDSKRKKLMRTQLERISDPNLSDPLRAIASKILESGGAI